MPRYAYAPVAPLVAQRDGAFADDIDLAQVVRRRITRRAQDHVHVEVAAVGSHQRAGAQRPRRTRHHLDVRLGQGLQIVGCEDQPLATERVLGSQLVAQVLVGHRGIERAQRDVLELLCLVAPVLDDADVGLTAQPQPGPVDLLGEGNVSEQPLLAVGVRAVGLRQNPRRRALHRVDLLGHLRDLGDQLCRCRSGTEDGHARVRQVDGVIPACGVHHRSGERLLLDEVGKYRLREQADRGDHDIECVLLSARGGQLPFLGRGVPPCRDDLGVQLQIPSQLIALCAAFEVLQDLRLAGPQARPVGIEVERIGIQMRLHIAGQTGIGVDPPGAADAVLAVEDREVTKAVLPQENPQRQPTRARADDSHRESLRHLVHPICR